MHVDNTFMVLLGRMYAGVIGGKTEDDEQCIQDRDAEEVDG